MASNDSSKGAGDRNSDRSCSSEQGNKISEPGFRFYGATDINPGDSTSAFRPEISDIPPADHGIRAWLFLFGVFWFALHSIFLHVTRTAN